MPYKNVLVHLDDGKACGRRVEAAIALAQAHQAHLTGLYVAADVTLPGSVRAEVPGAIVSGPQNQLKERMAEAEARFVKTVERAGLTADCRTAHGPAPRVPEIIALHARYADLVVLGQADPEEPGEAGPYVSEDVVLSCGRPGLVIPYIGAGKTLGERIMVAWDGGREAARAVNDAMPMLERATSVADALLSRLADEDIDLLVMGAYGHSRVREWVLGGTTRQIFDQMTVPVLMSH